MPVSLRKPAPIKLIVGTQWGDEGKGKVVDLLGEQADVVARYQGGPNAGHTVEFGGDKFILHLIPTGILRPHIHCVLGNGMVIHPDSFLQETAVLKEKGIDLKGRLHISPAAHLILDYHKELEKVCESSSSAEKIGTTGRGIGPAYADKASRIGIRIGDLFHEELLKNKVRENVEIKNKLLEAIYKVKPVHAATILENLKTFRESIRDCVCDTVWFLNQEMREGKRILVEGAQGTLLDIDFGTYPFVTSSNTTLGGMATGLGFGIRRIDQVIGILKAYTTRVGNGPFPTELTGEAGESLRKAGGEYGATTGRPRRCGWFDAVIARYAVMINGIDALAVMKLDVLDSFSEIRICTGYRILGHTTDRMPEDMNLYPSAEPVYETAPGWKKSIRGIRRLEDLPRAARNYLSRLEELSGAPIGMISVGPTREETIWLD